MKRETRYYCYNAVCRLYYRFCGRFYIYSRLLEHYKFHRGQRHCWIVGGCGFATVRGILFVMRTYQMPTHHFDQINISVSSEYTQ